MSRVTSTQFDSLFVSLPYFGAAALAAMAIYRDLSWRGWAGVSR